MTFELSPEPTDARLAAIEALTFELIPLRSAAAAIAALPTGSRVSVTCSPVKGIAATRELVDQVRAAGHVAIPHLAARLVTGRHEVDDLANWLRTDGLTSAFIVGGDAEEPAGPYADGTTLLRDLLAADPGLQEIGVPAYPDEHPLIDRAALDEALLAKQALLDEAGVIGWASTQMCFDPDRIVTWGDQQRAAGIALPIHLGLPGVVDRAKLLTMGMRLGVGPSLRYLRKNRRAVGRLLTRSDYDPDDLLAPLGPDLARLGITGVHCFTFNQVATTAAWRADVLAA
ncbi:MAG: 5,10-methylenetetrahydrofolate reductase [Actinomycetota bacterium]